MIRIRARGLDGFREDLSVAEERLVDGVHTLTSELADDTAKGARAKGYRGKKPKPEHAVDTVRARGPVVSAGEGIEHYGFYDFGGKVGPNRSISRRYIKGGRFLFPAVRDLRVGKRADAVVDDATKELQ